MAVIGTSSGGYATVNPVDGNPIGNAMQNVENSAFKYRAEKREEDQLEAQRAKAEKDARDAEAKDLIDYAGKHKITPTTIDSLNKAQTDFAIENKNKYAEFKGILNKSNDPEERRKAIEGVSNLETSWEAMKALPEFLNASAKDLEEGVRAGKYNPDSSTEAAKTTTAMANGQMKAVYGKDGNVKIITYQRDPQGNITNVIDKEYTIDQIKQKLSPIMAYDDATMAKEFKDSLGDKVKTEKGFKIIEGYTNLAETADKKANSIVTDRNQMYAMAKKAGVAPKFDISEYSPEEVKKVKDYIKESLTEKYKDSVTDNDAALSRAQSAQQFAAREARAKKEFEYKKQKDALDREDDNVDTTFTRNIITKPMPLGNSGYNVPAGSGKLVINSSGYKDKSGATRILQEAIRTPDGKYYFGVNERKVNMSKLTPEAEAKKNEPGFDKTDQNNYQMMEKVNYYDVDKQSDKVSLSILNTVNPDTGKKFKDVIEAKKWVKNNTHVGAKSQPKKSAKTPDSTKSDLRKKYNY